MWSNVVLETDHLRAELLGRETVQETAQFLQAVASESLKHERNRLLIVVRASRAIFKVEQYQISEYFKGLAERPGYRVALLSDSDEIHAAHGYVEVLARQRGLNVRAFRDEATALEWLRRAG